METRHEHIKVACSGGQIRIANDRIELRILRQDGGYAHELWSFDRKGRPQLVLSSLHKNLLIASECRVTSHPLVSGHRPHLFEACRESLRMVYSKAEVTHQDDTQAVAELTGSFLGHTLTTRTTIEAGSNLVHVSVSDEFERRAIQPLVEYLMSSYAFLPDMEGTEPDYLWTPILRPDDDHVIGDLAFHSPAVIVQHGRCAAAMIPDLDLLSEHRPMPASLDLDLRNGLLSAPLLSYGFCDYEAVCGGRYCRHDMTMAHRLNTWRVTYGFHLMVDADCDRRSAHRHAARFLWHRQGVRSRAERGRVPVSQVDVHSQLNRLRPDAQTAFGLRALGADDGDPRLAAAGNGMKEEVLSAPQDKGLFPTRYSAQSDEWNGCWFSIDQAHYHTVECSRQAYWLLKWHKHVEADPMIVRYARRYGDFLLRATLRSGAIPSWYTVDQTPMSPLLSGIQTAPSALLLAELADVTGFAKFARAAERSARFVLDDLVPRDVFQDYTLMDLAERSRHECADPHSHVRPQSSQAMLWVARLCLTLHKLTRNPTYLKHGRDALDRVCLMQSIWAKPWTDAQDDLGLIAQGNVGWACDPELSAEFARCAMGYAAATGEAEYAERAEVALSASIRAAAARPASRVRVAASAALIESTFGVAYVHVGRKWVVPLNGMAVRLEDVEGHRIALSISGNEDSRGTLVFGGLRAKSYDLCINGRPSRHARRDLERGIQIALPSPSGDHCGPQHDRESQLSLNLP
jgi:hypothetical protein